MSSLKILVFALAGFIGQAQAELQFLCPTQLAQLQPEATAYLRALQIPAAQIRQTLDPTSASLTLALTTPPNDKRTLDLATRPEFALTPERVSLPSGDGKTREVATVSRKEIMLALLQHGRITTLTGADCHIGALMDLVGLRQNIVAWAENLNWVWPDGDYAQWNPAYWTEGTPNPGMPLRQAVMDAFLQPENTASAATPRSNCCWCKACWTTTTASRPTRCTRARSKPPCSPTASRWWTWSPAACGSSRRTTPRPTAITWGN